MATHIIRYDDSATYLYGMSKTFSSNAGLTILNNDKEVYDIVVYGGTSAGIAAAVQAKRLGKSVVVIETSSRIGGLTTNGLGQTDIGAKSAFGGISREFYQAVRQYYNKEDAWKWQKRDDYAPNGQSVTDPHEDVMWTFEPSVALEIYNRWIHINDIPVFCEEKLNRELGVKYLNDPSKRITSITMESGKVFFGRVFIDATYEGDLMAASGVNYAWGREANGQYGETLNGVQVANAVHHQIPDGVDPYIEKGKPESGLLPFINPHMEDKDGFGDKRLQSYCFRMCLTDCNENRIPFEKPHDYDELWYELLFRSFESGEKQIPWLDAWMPNHKTDTNNNRGVSTDFIGQNYEYPEASHQERARIVQKHLLYQRGLMWTLANHPRVPDHVRSVVSRYGVCKDEFEENGGWPVQLYVREARRMVGDYVMTQADCQGKRKVEDVVALAAYTMDSHNTQRYINSSGHVKNEGDVQIGGFPPYPISYRSIVPQSGECDNLLVPVCLSASHIAYGSIRMEPVFMVLGQSASIAAAISLDEGVAVQSVDYSKLRKMLIKNKQVLDYVPMSK